MRHLINNSVYAPPNEVSFPEDIGGVELLTGYSEVPSEFYSNTVSVHLPYATDWYGAWSGERPVPDGLSDDECRFIFYGHDKDEIVRSFHDSIIYASKLNPEYGILHAGSANTKELLALDYSDSDDAILSTLAEAINSAVSEFPGGEPPFRILFENLWWPGLRMLDSRNYHTLCSKIEFDNWGLCLDTGHLLVSLKGSRTEGQAIELLKRTFDSYSKDMIDSIETVHLHFNDSGNYLGSYKEPVLPDDLSVMDLISMGYSHVCNMDQHRPFSSSHVKEIMDVLRPEYVVHEMGTPDFDQKIRDYRKQYGLFTQ